MLAEIDQTLRQCGGVAPRPRLLAVVTRAQLDHEIRTGRLVAPFPRTYCRPWDAEIHRERAALISAGRPAVLSHMTALRRWKLLAPDPEAEIHLSLPVARAPRSRPGLVVHRVIRIPPVALVDCLPAVHPADAAVASWAILPPAVRREPLITGVRTRIVTTQHLRDALAFNARTVGRTAIGQLVDLLESGCESELEIWGLLHVFDVAGLQHGKRQLWLQTRVGPVRIDLGFEAERVAVELDGARFHSTRDQRERDMRRDAALSSIGWVTLRFSYDRLHSDAEGCRRDTLATLAQRVAGGRGWG